MANSWLGSANPCVMLDSFATKRRPHETFGGEGDPHLAFVVV